MAIQHRPILTDTILLSVQSPTLHVICQSAQFAKCAAKLHIHNWQVSEQTSLITLTLILTLSSTQNYPNPIPSHSRIAQHILQIY